MGADGNLAPHRTCQQWRHTRIIHRQRIRILTLPFTGQAATLQQRLHALGDGCR
jgi:hypothetical protein